MVFLVETYSVLCEVRTEYLTKKQISCSFRRDEIVYIHLDIVCTVHFADFIMFVQQIRTIC